MSSLRPTEGWGTNTWATRKPGPPGWGCGTSSRARGGTLRDVLAGL